MKDVIFNKKSQISIFFFLSILIFVTIVFISTTSQRVNREVLESIPSRFAKDFFSGLDLERTFRLCADDSITQSLNQLSYGGYILSDENYSLFKEDDFRYFTYYEEVEGNTKEKKIPFGLERFNEEDFHIYFDVPDWPCNNITGSNCDVDFDDINQNFVFSSRPRALSDFRLDTITYDGAQRNYFLLPPLTSKRTHWGPFGFNKTDYNLSWEQQLSESVRYSLRECMDLEYYEETGYTVEERTDINVDVDISREEVSFDISWPIEILNSDGTESLTISNFNLVKDVNLYEIYTFLEELTMFLRESHNFDLEKEPFQFNSLSSSISYSIERKIDGSNNLVVLTDKNSNVGDEEYDFYFPLQNRPPILETLEFPELKSGENDIFIMVGDDLIFEPLGMDPEDDDLEYFYFGWNSHFNLSDDFERHVYSLLNQEGYDFSDYTDNPKNVWQESELYKEGRFEKDNGSEVVCNNPYTESIDKKRCSFYSTNHQDEGVHKLVVGVREKATPTSVDWQVLNIAVDSAPEAKITIRDIFKNNFQSDFYSIEDPFIFDARETGLGLYDGKVEYFWELSENLGGKKFNVNSQQVTIPFENYDEEIGIFNIDSFDPFNETTEGSVFLTVEKEVGGNTVSSQAEYPADIRSCVPYIDETKEFFSSVNGSREGNKIAAPFPFNYFVGQKNVSPYYSVPDNDFEGSNTCCDSEGNIKSTNSLCYDFEYVHLGIPPQYYNNNIDDYVESVEPWNVEVPHEGYDTIYSIINDYSSSSFNLITNFWSTHQETWFSRSDKSGEILSYNRVLLENTFFCRRISVECNVSRGNICSGDVYDRWGVINVCGQDSDDHSDIERCNEIISYYDLDGDEFEDKCISTCEKALSIPTYVACDNPSLLSCEVTEVDETGQQGNPVCFDAEKAFYNVPPEGKSYTSESNLIDPGDPLNSFPSDFPTTEEVGSFICRSTCDGEGGCDYITLNVCENCDSKNDVSIDYDNEQCTFYDDHYSVGETPGDGECVPYELSSPVTVSCFDSEMEGEYYDYFSDTESSGDEEKIEEGDSGITDRDANTCQWVERGILGDNGCKRQADPPLLVMDSGCDWKDNKEACCGVRDSAAGHDGFNYDELDQGIFDCTGRYTDTSPNSPTVNISVVTEDKCVYPNTQYETCERVTLECNSENVCKHVSDLLDEDGSMSSEFMSNWEDHYEDFVCHAKNYPGAGEEKFVWIREDELPQELNAKDDYDNNCDGGIDCGSYDDNTKGRFCSSDYDEVCVINSTTFFEGDNTFFPDRASCEDIICKRDGELASPNSCIDGNSCINLYDGSYAEPEGDILDEEFNGIWFDGECYFEGPFYYDDNKFSGQNMNSFDISSNWKKGCEKGYLCTKSISDFRDDEPADGICVDENTCKTDFISLNGNILEYDFNRISDSLSYRQPCIAFNKSYSDGFKTGFVVKDGSGSNYCLLEEEYYFYSDSSLRLNSLFTNKNMVLNFEDNLVDFDFKTIPYDSNTGGDTVFFCDDSTWVDFEKIRYNIGIYDSNDSSECCQETFAFDDFTDVGSGSCSCENWNYCFDYNLDVHDDNNYLNYGRCVNDECCTLDDVNHIVFDDNTIDDPKCLQCNSSTEGDYCYNLDKDGEGKGDYGICSLSEAGDHVCSNAYSEDPHYSECFSDSLGMRFNLKSFILDSGSIVEGGSDDSICVYDGGFNLVDGKDEVWANRESSNDYIFLGSSKGDRCDNIIDNEWNFDEYTQNSIWVDSDTCAICNETVSAWKEEINQSNEFVENNEYVCSSECGDGSSQCNGKTFFSQVTYGFCNQTCDICDVVSTISSTSNLDEEVTFGDGNEFNCGCEDISKEDEYYFCEENTGHSNQFSKGICSLSSDSNQELFCSKSYRINLDEELLLTDNNEVQSCSGVENEIEPQDRLSVNKSNKNIGFCYNGNVVSHLVEAGSDYIGSGNDLDICYFYSDVNQEIIEGRIIDEECVDSGFFSMSESNEMTYSDDYNTVCDDDNDVCANFSYVLSNNIDFEYSSLKTYVQNHPNNKQVGFCNGGSCVSCEGELYITDSNIFDDSSGDNLYGTCNEDFCQSPNSCDSQFIFSELTFGYCDFQCEYCDVISKIESSSSFSYDFDTNEDEFRCDCVNVSKDSEYYFCSNKSNFEGFCTYDFDENNKECSTNFIVDQSGSPDFNENGEFKSCIGVDDDTSNLDEKICRNIEGGEDDIGLCYSDECLDYLVKEGSSFSDSGSNGDVCYVTIKDDGIIEGVLYNDECYTQGNFTLDESGVFTRYTNSNAICDNDNTICGDIESIVTNNNYNFNYAELKDHLKDTDIDSVGFCKDDTCVSCSGNNWIDDVDVFDDGSGTSSPYGECSLFCGSDSLCDSSSLFVSHFESNSCVFCDSECFSYEHEIKYNCESSDLDNGFCYDDVNHTYFNFNEGQFCDSSGFNYSEFDDGAYPEGSFNYNETTYFIFDLGSFRKVLDQFGIHFFSYNNVGFTSLIDLSQYYYGDFYYNVNYDSSGYSSNYEDNVLIFPTYDESEEKCNVYDDSILDDLNQTTVNNRKTVDCSNYFYYYTYQDEVSSLNDREYEDEPASVYRLTDEQMKKFGCTLTDCVFDTDVIGYEFFTDEGVHVQDLSDGECYDGENVISC
ncbi:MAG: hypothetical protein ACOCP4_00110 [Candidatus Woesearchaeota archaeon]